MEFCFLQDNGIWIVTVKLFIKLYYYGMFSYKKISIFNRTKG